MNFSLSALPPERVLADGYHTKRHAFLAYMVYTVLKAAFVKNAPYLV